MSAPDLRAVIDADTRLLEQALQKAVAKPYKLNFSVDQGSSGALGRIRSQLGEFDKSLAASNARVMAFSLSASAMFGVTKSLKEMVRVTVEVERKMTSINSILGAGRSQFKQFGNDLFKIARDTSTSFEEVADAAEELARQGVGIEETLKRTSSAMKLAKVSGVEVRTAVDAITAALNSNNDAWLDSEKLINKLVAVDAKFAVSAGGLAEAIKRVGSVASDAGLDIDDLIAAITSAQQTTARGEAVIGNALKTIFTRAQRPKVLEDFESLGIATKDAVGNIRPLAGVLTEVAKRYDDLSSAQQQSVSELVGGVYQINILKALFRDLGKETSFFGSALKTSQRATNEADLRIAQLNETLDAMFKKLVVNMTQVGSGVGENVFGPLFKNLLKSANSGLEAVSREMSGESGKFFGNAFEAVFKGIGNTLNSPILIGGFITISRFILQTAREGREAIKTLAGLNNSFHSLEVVSADAANWLRQNPKILLDIATASKTAEGATRALTAATAAYHQEKARGAALQSGTETYGREIARMSGIISIPGRGGTERLQATKKVPNFAPLSSAIARESFSVNPGLIRVGSHSALRGPGNPDGVGVYNLRDEPMGLGQGVQRALGMGLNPKTHGIPNYADGPVRQWAGRQKEAYFGGEGSPDPGNKFMYAMAASMAGPAISTFAGGGKTSKIAEEATNAISLYFTLSTFLRGAKGGKVATGAAVLSGIFGAAKQFTNSFNTLDTEIQTLKDNIQKASGGLNKYATTLEQLQDAYLNNNISAEKIGKLQNKLAESLSQLPAELRGQLIGAKSGAQVQNIIGGYTKSQDTKLSEKEFAMGLSTLLNEQSILRRGSLLGFQESGTKTGKEKLDAIADSLLSSISEAGLKKVGGAAGLGGGNLLSVLGAAGLGGSTLTQLGRVNSGELKAIQTRMASEQGSRESDVQKFKALAPQRQREIEQAQILEKRMKGARDTIKQTFEQIGQIANLRISIAGRRGLMGATGIGEQIQGTASLIGETGSPAQAAMANYKAQIAQNQIQAASGISNVFGGLRGGISTLYSNTDLSRMGDIPARMRAGQGSLMNILGGSSVSGIGEDAISLFKSLGKDDDVGEIKKLMADSNEKLVEIYQTLEEQNKLAEMQKNIALQRIEFERTLKVGGGLGSFMDRGVKAQQLGDIYSGKFGLQTGIFSGQGSIDLMRAFLGAGGKTGGAGFKKLMGVATESRAQDIISTQRDLNNAFSGTGLSLDVPSLADARKIAETQIAAELKTGDSAMEKQMAQLQAALSNTLSSTMGGQLNSAAQIFGNVLAGSSVFANLNSTIDSTQKTLQNLDATLKSLQGGGGYGVRAGGNIPISAAATEKMMAKAGGYNPGYIRRAGNLIYNSAERVDYLPGVREPVISPPPGSLAGFLHRQNLNAAFGFAAGGSSYGNYTRFDPNLKYLVQPSMGDPLTLDQRARARKAGYELLTPEDRAKMLANQKRFRGGKYNITDLTADFREGSEVGRRLPNRLASSFSISTPTDLGFGGNKFIESQRLSGFEKSLDLEEFIKRKNLVRKAFGEQLLDINRPSSYASILEKELGSAYYLKPKDGAQGVGVLGNSQLSASTKIKGKNYFAQRAISNMSGGEFRVTAVGGKYGASVADIGYKRTAKGLIGNAFYELADDPTKGKTVGEKFDQFLSKTIAKAQAKRALASLPPQMRAGAVAGFDVAETGTKGVKKFLQAASEVTDIGREMFKGAGGVIEANLSDPAGYSGSLAKPSTNLKTAKLYSQAVNKNVLDKIIQSKGFQKTASVAGGVTKGVVNPFQILADTSVELGSRYAGAFAGRQKGVGAHKFGALSETVGQTYLEERMDQLNEPGSDAFFGLSPGSWLRYGLTNESLGLMESYGDVEVAKKKYAISKDKKLKRQAFRDTAYSASRSEPFTPGITYQDMSEHNKMLSSVAKGVASSTVTEGPNAAMQTIGNLKNWRNSLNPMDQRRGLYEKEIRDRSVQSNAETIAKTFGISDPKQMQRLQVGVQNAMDKGNLQGYVKSLGKPVVAAAPAPTAEKKGEKQAGGDKSELTVNVNMGGNLGVKNAGVEFSEEQYIIINSIVAKVAEGIDEKVKAILRQQPAEVRSNVAASSPPTNPGGNFRGTPYGV